MKLVVSDAELARIKQFFEKSEGEGRGLGLLLIDALTQSLEEIRQLKIVLENATVRCDMLSKQLWQVRGKNNGGVRG